MTFKQEIEAFCERTGISGRKFGELAVGDGAFWFKLGRGRDPRLSTVEKCRKFIADYQG